MEKVRLLGRQTLEGLLVVSVLFLFAVAPAAARAEPKLVESTPSDGAALEALPASLNLCFSEPVKGEREHWRFNVRPPGRGGLGLRIVFATDFLCVDVFPGAGEDPAEGIWSLDWLVRAQSDGAEGSGVIRFQVGELQPGETPLPEPQEERGPAGDDDTPTALIALAAVGAAIVVFAGAAFALRRIRRPG